MTLLHRKGLRHTTAVPAIVVAYRMFERWRQESFFKYIKAEYLIDALADYQIEPDDPHRSVPNPARKALEQEMRRTRSQLEKLRARYAEATLGSRSHPHPRPTKKETRACAMRSSGSKPA